MEAVAVTLAVDEETEAAIKGIKVVEVVLKVVAPTGRAMLVAKLDIRSANVRH
jgi:hypothetical protein